jgi:hypothetical protein
MRPPAAPSPAAQRKEAGRAAALDAIERGYGVLWAAKDAKRPAVVYSRGNANATPPVHDAADLASGIWNKTLARWENGVCILLREGQYVLDGDTPEGAALVREVGANTLRVATERGVHAYFTLPDGVRLRQGAGVVAPGVDGKGVASTGNYTISMWWTPDGSRTVENDVPPAPLPETWISRLRAPAPRTEVRKAGHTAVVLDAASLAFGDEALLDACDALRGAFRKDPEGAWARKAWGAAKEMSDWVRVGYPFDKAFAALYAVFKAEATHDERPDRIPQAIENGLRA